MKQRDLESQVLQLWTSTRIPLTLVNLQVLTGVPREKLQKWLDALVSAGTLELDSDADGNLLWQVPGTPRAPAGVTTVDEFQRLSAIKGSVPVSIKSPRGGRLPVRTTGPADEKSVLASGALSFFLGPFGWLYAAPVTDAVAGILLYMLLSALLPTFMFFWLLGIAQPLSALLGMLYAWQYNQKGERVSLKDVGREEDRPKLLK